MNPITLTAIKLEKEAWSLYSALKTHTSLYGRHRLSEKPPEGAMNAALASPTRYASSNASQLHPSRRSSGPNYPARWGWCF